MEEFTGKLVQIDPRKVVVDHRYQRPEKESLIAAIASDPRWELFGALVVFRRGSEELYYCADGQQRLRGILESEDPPRKVPAVVFTVPSLEDEAGIFVRINEFRKQLTPIEKHEGKKTAKEPAALAIERATEKVGFSISSSTDSARAVHSPVALYHAYNLLGEDGVVQLLTVLSDAWPDDRRALSSRTIKMVANVMAEKSSNGGMSRTALTRKLGKTSPGALFRRAEEIHFDTGKAKTAALRAAFKDLAGV